MNESIVVRNLRKPVVTSPLSPDTFVSGRTVLYEFARQNYGMGIAQHIRALRIAHAKKLLIEQPDMNISQVAEVCGFKDYNYFITVFGKTVGVAPRQYRLNAVSPDAVPGRRFRADP